ncbi:AraC family transcriptional regulator [Fictibacillus enclensis]|uniref:AraC family transcriptional regulator n=2 Tax=Fictibacillus enclensis TaxID=1017270 RepID=A0A0V8J459_9BACL|nr:AraC family transcriptional regulator [Fictibacillus enclensis]
MEKCMLNYVLNAKSNQFYYEGKGQLSIKTFRNGRAHYKTNSGFFAVEEDSYLLLNAGDYAISIEEETEVESFCLFFTDELAGEVMSTLSEAEHSLLDDPFKTKSSAGFFEKTYPISADLSQQIDYFRGNMSFQSATWQEEQFHTIMEHIITEQCHLQNEIIALPALKRSTREEVYRRVSVAHEYIRAFFHLPLTLKEISHIACLSPNHLIKNYTAVYGCTPHQHITAYRVQKAIQLLKQPEISMTRIAFELGFETPASFSKMFKQQTGCSPLSYRKKVILDKKD